LNLKNKKQKMTDTMIS
jgi:26S proteasome regulatory subunit N8